MKKFFSDFKAFAMRGNVVELAVAVIIGGAFGKITTSFVNDMIMPLFGILLGGVKFSALSVTIGDAQVMYGNFIQSIVDFIIIAFAIFVAIRVMERFKKPRTEAPAEEPKKPEDIALLEEIRDLLKERTE